MSERIEEELAEACKIVMDREITLLENYIEIEKQKARELEQTGTLLLKSEETTSRGQYTALIYNVEGMLYLIRLHDGEWWDPLCLGELQKGI